METPSRRQYNAFTTREVALLKKHWPTTMPMAELLALLPRHTEYSLTGYANKVLGLKRPHVKRVHPAWDRVREMLSTKRMTQLEIAAEMGFSRSRASEILRAHSNEVYIAGWRWPENMGRAEALWSLGSEPNVPEPIGETRTRKLSARRANPFLVAAGLIAPLPSGAGRVYRQSMNVEDDQLEAA